MNKPTQEQIERLPKWAQEYISTLERKVEDAERAVVDLKQDQPTRMYWEFGHRDDKKYIPENSRIYIERPHRDRSIVIHWDNTRDMLNVHAEIGSLIVRPHSSNWIHVHAE